MANRRKQQPRPNTHRPMADRAFATANGRFDELTVAQAADRAEACDQTLDIIPVHCRREMVSGFGRIVHVADQLRIGSVADLIDVESKNMTQAISLISGIEDVNRFRTSADMDGLHRSRSILGAMLALAAYETGADPIRVLTRLPNLPSRGLGRARPLRPDELPLIRVASLHALNRQTPRNRASAAHYAFAECGAMSAETPQITGEDLDNLRKPTVVSVPGTQVNAARDLSIDGFASRLVEGFLDLSYRGHDARTSLTYRGGHAADSHAVSADASSLFRRSLLLNAGLTDVDLTPQSISYARAYMLESSGDRDTAAQVMGVSADRVPELLCLITDADARMDALQNDDETHDYKFRGDAA